MTEEKAPPGIRRKQIKNGTLSSVTSCSLSLYLSLSLSFLCKCRPIGLPLKPVSLIDSWAMNLNFHEEGWKRKKSKENREEGEQKIELIFLQHINEHKDSLNLLALEKIPYEQVRFSIHEMVVRIVSIEDRAEKPRMRCKWQRPERRSSTLVVTPNLTQLTFSILPSHHLTYFILPSHLLYTLISPDFFICFNKSVQSWVQIPKEKNFCLIAKTVMFFSGSKSAFASLPSGVRNLSSSLGSSSEKKKNPPKKAVLMQKTLKMLGQKRRWRQRLFLTQNS